MREDLDSLTLVYRDNLTGQYKRLPALDWIGQLGPIGEAGNELELVGWEDDREND
jgi:hypothetical protein